MDLGDHVWALREGLLSLLRDQQFTDITLRVGGREFRAHRTVLAAGSEYFKASFTKGFAEGTKDLLEFPDLDPDVFRLVLELIYGEREPVPGSIKAEFEFIRQCYYFKVTGIMDGALLHRDDIPLENFSDYLTLLTTVYPEGGIPERYQVTVRKMIDQGADLSVLSDETLLQLLPGVNYHPKNLLKFHKRLQKLVDEGHSPELFSLVNYQLLAPEDRPVGREEKGPIPSLQPNEHERINCHQKFLLVSGPLSVEIIPETDCNFRRIEVIHTKLLAVNNKSERVEITITGGHQFGIGHIVVLFGDYHGKGIYCLYGRG